MDAEVSETCPPNSNVVSLRGTTKLTNTNDVVWKQICAINSEISMKDEKSQR